MMFLLNVILVFQDPSVIVREPQLASPWIQTLEAKCSDQELRVANYGARNPVDTEPQVHLNSQPMIGSGSEQLLRDLSNYRAVYRFQVLCNRDDEITLVVGEGESPYEGPIRYRVSSARFTQGRLVSYSGFEEANEAAFWFR